MYLLQVDLSSHSSTQYSTTLTTYRTHDKRSNCITLSFVLLIFTRHYCVHRDFKEVRSWERDWWICYEPTVPLVSIYSIHSNYIKPSCTTLTRVYIWNCEEDEYPVWSRMEVKECNTDTDVELLVVGRWLTLVTHIITRSRKGVPVMKRSSEAVII